MTDWREELIEKMAKAAWESDGTTCDLLLETYLTEARAALAVAEPVIREQADNALREENARLREENDAWRMDGGSCAEEVKRLREENARLRGALKPFAEAFESDYAEQEEDHWDLWESAAASILTYGHLRAAAAAILGKIKDEAACPAPDEAP